MQGKGEYFGPLFRLNPLFPGDNTLNYLENLHVSTTLSSTDSTPSSTTPSTSSTDSLDPSFVKEFTKIKLNTLKQDALSGLAGVYAIICNVTGAMYIGS